MAPKSVTFRRHDHLVSVLFGDLLSHSYNITFSMFLYLVLIGMARRIPGGVIDKGNSEGASKKNLVVFLFTWSFLFFEKHAMFLLHVHMIQLTTTRVDNVFEGRSA